MEHHTCVYTMHMRVIGPDVMYGQPRERALDLSNGAVSEKMPQIFLPSLSAECVSAFSRRTDAPEVRCDLSDTQTDSNYCNPRCACAPRVNQTELSLCAGW